MLLSKDEIVLICEKYDIMNYTIKDDGTVDVDGSVYLDCGELTELPLKFGTVTGWFNCSRNLLTTLEGSPKVVYGSFTCNNNRLTSLEEGPENVGFKFVCSMNKLTTLKGCPKSIGKDFICNENRLVNIDFIPDIIKDKFLIHGNPISSIFNEANMDFLKAFKTYRIIKDGVLDLKRLKYLSESFDLNLNINEIEKYYTIKVK
jgi:hypothetical protein